MQDMTPDMEELLRKASEAYPLKQMEDRWQDIAPSISMAQEQKKSGGVIKYVLALVAMFLVVAAGQYFFNSIPNNRSDANQLQRRDAGRENRAPISSSKDNNKATGNQAFINAANEIGKQKVYMTSATRIAKKSFEMNVQVSPASREYARDIYTLQVIRSATQNGTKHFSGDVNKIQQSIALLNIEQNNVSNDQISKWYYGVALGPELNSVNYSGISKPGFNIGFIAGYRFSSKLSVEAGLSLTHKSYFANGSDFSMKEMAASMPPPMQLMKVDGSSSILEMPVRIRYDLVAHKNYGISASAGLSSYLLTREENAYHISMNGSEQMMYGNYKSNKKYLAASVDLGIGFNKSLNNQLQIGVQPYLQLPLKGIGVGSLPVSGTGLRLTLTKNSK